MEKFVTITFVICLLGTTQCTLADESKKVEGQLDENGRFLMEFYANVKQNVDDRVQKVTGSVKSKIEAIPGQIMSDVSARVSTVAKNSYIVGRAVNATGDAINNMVIPLPYSAKNTEYGAYINKLSDQLSNGVKVLEYLMTTVDDTVAGVSNATQDLLRKVIDQLHLKRDGSCLEAVREMEQNFTKTVITNLKACVSQGSKAVVLYTASVNELQVELNAALQDGKFRVGLMNDIVAALTTLQDKAKEIGGVIPECEVKHIINSFGSSLSDVGSKCFYSFFEKE